MSLLLVATLRAESWALIRVLRSARLRHVSLTWLLSPLLARDTSDRPAVIFQPSDSYTCGAIPLEHRHVTVESPACVFNFTPEVFRMHFPLCGLQRIFMSCFGSIISSILHNKTNSNFHHRLLRRFASILMSKRCNINQLGLLQRCLLRHEVPDRKSGPPLAVRIIVLYY